MAVGPWQIVIIALIILLLFGASRLSDIGKGLGEGIRNFKKGIADDGDDEKGEPDDKEEKEKKEPKRLTGKSAASTEKTDEKPLVEKEPVEDEKKRA